MTDVNNLSVASPDSAHTVAHIRDEIVVQASALLTDDLSMNSISFTLRLPIEILEAIFIHRACDYFGEHSRWPSPTPPTWVHVSYVCRHWRNVALNCPTLWSYLFVVSPRWTDELLSRSKQAPLKIYVTRNDSDESCPVLRFLNQVISHTERIQEFRLYLSQLPENTKFISKLLSRAPRLQLVILVLHDVPLDSSPPILFDGETPALHTLELFNLPIPWYLLNLSSLTTLCLHGIHTRFRQDTQEVLAALSCMQDLRHLDLHDALASADPFLSNAGLQRIALPHLARLSITASLPTIIVFLSYINMPQETEVRITGYHKDDSSFSGTVRLASLLAQKFYISDERVLSIPIIRSLIMESTHVGATLVFSSTELNIGTSSYIPSAQWGCGIPLQINIVSDVSQMMMMSIKERIMSEICCTLPLMDIQTLHVIAPLSQAFWRSTLGVLPGLRRLTLCDGDMSDLLSVLCPIPSTETADQDGASTPIRVLVPALEMLHLSRISFFTPWASRSDMLRYSGIQPLCDSLSSRRESRGELTMVCCLIHTTDRSMCFDMAGTWAEGRFNVTMPPSLHV